MTIDSAIPSSTLGPAACEKDAKAIEFIEEMTKNVESVQKRVLAEILNQNSNTEYLQRFKLHGATDTHSFKSNVPVITYEDIKPDIQRIVNGDKSPIFTSQPISVILSSTGTSHGVKKLLPTIHEESLRRLQLFSLLMPVMNLYVPGLDKGKGLYFLFATPEIKTPGGIHVSGVLSSIYKNPQFHSRPHDPYLVFTSPNETILCEDSFQSMYAQMLCGILTREEVLRMGAVFACGLLRSIQFLQLNWKQLVHDIRTGTLNPMITDSSVRECIMSNILKPNHVLAEFIKNECEVDNWEKIIPRIWPHIKYLDVIVTGTMAQYIPTLDYYSGGLPIASTNYASSECHLGINLKPLCKPSEVAYTIMPNMGYFEFIRYDDSDNSSSESTPYLIDLTNVEIGKQYELVITTYSGLYRYRMSDILQVTSFHNATQQFKFIKRKNVVLSIDFDKTTETELQKGIENASALLRPYNVVVVEYTTFADIKTIPGHYVIYWELLSVDKNIDMSHEALNECCMVIEESFSSVYKYKRSTDVIGPLEIRVVRKGTFQELMDYAISKGASINQYKVSKCVNFTPIVELLNSRVISVHFSHVMTPYYVSNHQH